MAKMKFRTVVENREMSQEEKEARWELWRQGDLSWKLKGKQEEIYNDIINQTKDVSVALCSRRFGKCLAEGTQVPTPDRGFVNIEDLKVGDLVYGYNSDGTVTPTRVLDVIYQGEKEVYDLTSNNRKLISCTLDHKFLTKNLYNNKNEELSVRYFHSRSKILTKTIKHDYGVKNIQDAYAIGALIGDGCSRQKKGYKSVYISSKDEEVIKGLSNSINSKDITKNSKKNYTWRIGLTEHFSIDLYKKWIHGKYAHEKLLDWDEVKTWNRKSKLRLLAGLIDTDGSVAISSRILTIQFGMQAKSVVEVFCKLIKELWFYDVTLLVENRDKYKNGPIHHCTIRNNLISKRILKELDEFLCCPRKKWKDEYNNLLENNTRPDCIGVQVVNPTTKKTYDIEVDNETHLYLVENGLVTHNSTSALVPCIEVCLQNPDAIIKYACPTQKMVKKMIYPALKVIFHDAPPELELDKLWNATEGELKFPNGSILTIAGTDGNNADNLRGAYAHLVIADEAGFMDDLDYVIKSVLLPQTDTTGGKLILLSTPNFYNINHEFHTEYVKPFDASGKLVKFTLFDSPMVNDQEREKIISRYKKGINDPKFRCEYMVEIPTSTETSVIPEFYQNRKEIILDKIVEPDICDYYVGGDIGTNDPTAFLFGYYDFNEATLYITDEWISEGAGKEISTSMIATAIKLKEEDNFKRPPFKRVIDNNSQILVTDLRRDHGLGFFLTKKDNKLAQVNKVRDLMSEGQIKISSKCKNLIYQLTCGQWEKNNGNKLEFDHLEESIDGDMPANHLDLVDCLIYMVRNVNFGRNPKQHTQSALSENQYQHNRNTEQAPNAGLMQKLFGVKGKRK